MPPTHSHAEFAIPDSIEPIIGWKTLTAEKKNGVWQLLSPQQQMPWPARQRAEATCTHHTDHEWQAIRGNPNQPETHELTSYYGNTVFVQEITKPQVELPDGYNWSWEPIPHQVAGSGCCCGIYFVDTAEQCLPYIAGPSVICKVAMWGTVVKAAFGARGQYAYPQTIEYATGLNDKQLLEIAEQYGLQLPDEVPPPPVQPPNPPTYMITSSTTTIPIAQFNTTTNKPSKKRDKRKLASPVICVLLVAGILNSHDWLTSTLLISALLITAIETLIIFRSS